MKKFTALIALVLLFSVSLFVLSSCGDKAESKAESKSESKAESKSESKAESKSESKTESKAESKTESKEESKPDIFTFEIDRTKTKTNEAASKEYELSPEADSTYADEENKSLTDGIKHSASGGAYGNAMWVGFLRVPVSVTVDLGEIVEAIADFEAYLYRDEATGISMPSTMTISVSEDGETFYEAANITVSNDDVKFDGEDKTAGHIAKIELEKGVKAQFVKFDFESSNWLFISELEISTYK